MLSSRGVAISALVAALVAGSCADFAGSDCRSSACAEDALISDQVRAQIRQNSSLQFLDIRVQTANHVVYLQGRVDNAPDRDQAEEIARAVPGVTRVDNGLALDYTPY